MEMNEITKEQFDAYEKVRESDETNMFAVSQVIRLSEGALTQDIIMSIMKNYSELKEKFHNE